MAMFGQLNQGATVQLIQQKFATMFNALEDLERVYLWLSAYSLSDLEAAPLNLPAADAQMVLNALADFNDWLQTGQGTNGFPLPSLPYNFFASMRMVTGPR
jgi:hypothetical protein